MNMKLSYNYMNITRCTHTREVSAYANRDDPDLQRYFLAVRQIEWMMNMNSIAKREFEVQDDESWFHLGFV